MVRGWLIQIFIGIKRQLKAQQSEAKKAKLTEAKKAQLNLHAQALTSAIHFINWSNFLKVF